MFFREGTQKQVSRKERLRSSETKKIMFPGELEDLLGKDDICTTSWKLKTDKNVLKLSPFCNHE